jgi:hypothetical protein
MTIYVSVVLILVAAKLFAATVGLLRQLRDGGAVAVKLRKGSADAAEALVNLIHRSNPIDRILYNSEPTLVQLACGVAFRAPTVISLAAAGLAVVDQGRYYPHGLTGLPAWLALILAVATATAATVHLLTAVLRRLVLGADDSQAHDVRPAGFAFSKDWAVSVDEGSNLPLYFLGLVFLSVVAFAALYAGLDATSAHSFTTGDLAPSALNWLYFSMTTVATVGYGDVHAHSVVAQLSVIWQIATGPLLLSWLLAVFLTPRSQSNRDPV